MPSTRRSMSSTSRAGWRRSMCSRSNISNTMLRACIIFIAIFIDTLTLTSNQNNNNNGLYIFSSMPIFADAFVTSTLPLALPASCTDADADADTDADTCKYTSLSKPRHRHLTAITINRKKMKQSEEMEHEHEYHHKHNHERITLTTTRRRSILQHFASAIVGGGTAAPTIAQAALSSSSSLLSSSSLSTSFSLSTISEPEECKNGAIIAESAVPGSYQQVCMGLNQRTIQLQTTGEQITVLQGAGMRTKQDEDNSDNNGNTSNASITGRTGVALWNSGILLARLLDALAKPNSNSNSNSNSNVNVNSNSNSNFLLDKTVMELGCGTGLASIVASKLGATYVYATDGNEEVVNLAKLNLRRNGILDNGNGNGNGTNGARDNIGSVGGGEACQLKWGLLDASDYYDSADIIIGSDLTYNSGTWGLLSETLSSVLKPNGIVLYLTLGHSGFSVAGELGGFLTVVESTGSLEVVREGSAEWPFSSNGRSSLDGLLGSTLSARERDVLSTTGGYKVVVLKKKGRRSMRS